MFAWSVLFMVGVSQCAHVMPPTDESYKGCVAIDIHHRVSSRWCYDNCHHPGVAFCPSQFCDCSSANNNNNSGVICGTCTSNAQRLGRCNEGSPVKAKTCADCPWKNWGWWYCRSDCKKRGTGRLATCLPVNNNNDNNGNSDSIINPDWIR